MAEPERLAGRTGQVWRAYLSGEPQTSIAQRFGISQARVSQLVREARAASEPVTKEQEIERTLDLYQALRSELLAVVVDGPVPLYSAGKAVLLDDGTRAKDHSQRLAAIDRMVKLDERASKLLGLDAAVRTEVAVSEAEAREVQDAAIEATSWVTGQSS